MENEIKNWKVKALQFSSRTYEDARKEALSHFSKLKAKSKRKLYVKSDYFGKQKIFFDYFWDLVFQKPIGSRKQRLKLLPCAVELVQKSSFLPESTTNPNKKQEIFYRFEGVTQNG